MSGFNQAELRTWIYQRAIDIETTLLRCSDVTDERGVIY
jgi:hypothetical protein